MRRAARRAIGYVSCRSRYAATGDLRSWCAHAHDNQNRWHWRVHVAIWDGIFEVLGQRDHCARSSALWRRYHRLRLPRQNDTSNALGLGISNSGPSS